MIRGKVLGGSSGINGMMWTSMRGRIGHDGDDDAVDISKILNLLMDT